MDTASTGEPITGVLHVFVAFDWGDEIDLEKVRLAVQASQQELPRRRRTPTSFSYRPAPLHVDLGSLPLSLPELGEVQAQGGVTLFDFAAVSMALRVPFSLTSDAMARLAGRLADAAPVVQQAKAMLAPLHARLLHAIQDPLWQDDQNEEYFVFQFPPNLIRRTEELAWLAALVHLEKDPLSSAEISEALRLRLSYSPDDLFVPDWPAAVLVDRECDETLQAIEFANLQLLEFRHIDNRLDESLAAGAKLIHPRFSSSLPFLRHHTRALRALGELKVEANGLFERTGNVLKLVGDPYLARVYRLVARRFHLDTWIESIQRKLDVAEGVYQVLADQAHSFRAEFLEIVVVVLILFEVMLTLFRH